MIHLLVALCFYASGSNENGQLGLNSTEASVYDFAEGGGLFDKVALGEKHALGLLQGTLYGWGSNTMR